MARVTSATVRLVLKKLKVNKNGESPVYLSVCFHGRLEKSTSISVLPRYWDEKRECIKNGCPNAPVLNKMLQDMKNKVIERKNEFEYQKRVYTPTMLLQDTKNDFNGASNSFKKLMDRIIEERHLQDGTIRGYTYTYRKWCEYLDKRDFIIDELVLSVVKGFADWMERNNIKTNTIKRLLANTASIWNYAIAKKLTSSDDYPFTQFKYTVKYKDICRDYFLEKSHIVRLRDYWMNLVIERHSDKRWSYKDGAFERLHNRNSKEFGILYFLLCYKFGGSAPIDVALLRPENVKRVSIKGEDYWAIDTKRKKTSRDVHIRLKRDLLTIIGLEHFLGFCGHYIYPIINWKEGMSDRFMHEQVHKVSDKAIRKVREAFMDINSDIARDNALNGSNEPTVDLTQLVMYSARHSRASNYFNTEGATIAGLASMLARSSNTIATYAHHLKKDEDLAEIDDVCPI